MFLDNDKVSAREVTLFILVASIQTGTLFGSRTLASQAGTDIWLALILGHLFTVPAIFIIVKLGQRFYKHEFVGYSKIITGPIIGWALSSVIVVYWIFVSAKVINSIVEVTKLNLLNRTPDVVIILTFMLTAVYLCWYGIEPIIRTSVIIALVIIPLMLISYVVAIRSINLNNFLPVLKDGFTPILKLGIKEIGDFEELSFFLFLIPFLNRSKKATKSAFFAFGAIFVFVLLFYTLPVGVLGVETVKHRNAPLIDTFDVIEIEGFFIERLGVVFTGAWIIIGFPTTCGLLYASSLTLSKMFGLTDHKRMLIPLAALIIAISFIPGNIVENNNFYKFLTPLGFAVLLFIPLLLYITAVIRGVKDE